MPRSFRPRFPRITSILNPLIFWQELPKELVEKLKDTIGKKLVKPGQQLSLSTKIDPSILGGLILQIGDKTIDMAVSSKLLKLKQSLAN